MIDVDAARLGSIARALGVPPRALLLAVMRHARRPDAYATEPRQWLAVDDGGAAAVDLLLTPIADFGHDAVERAFARIWPPEPGR